MKCFFASCDVMLTS